MNLQDIHSPADVKKLDMAQLTDLAAQMRKALIEKLSVTGGHVGPNLGVVEATLAMHYVFDMPKDKIVYDVSHQSYVHKMLTGRALAFTDPAHYDDVTGYTNPTESPDYDIFSLGHTSSSVALAAGLAKQRDLKGISGKEENIVCFIGDGSITGGVALEGIDNVATLGSNYILVFNDNQMSIAENHGGVYRDFDALRETNGTDPCNFFKAMGIEDYRYVPYGNDVEPLVKVFEEVKGIDHPVVVHIDTQKGEGYKPAEADREDFHYSGPFDIATGEPAHISKSENYADIFASHMLSKIKAGEDVTVITAGTPGVLGFGPQERAEAGRHFLDAGIAEQCAVGMAAGIARAGGRPVFGVMSTFLQRAYDQLEQDVAVNRLPVVLNIFGGGLSAMVDETHLGWFDIAMVANLPGWVYLAPTCKEEYLAMLDWAIAQTDYPVAIRVPSRGVVTTGRTYPTDYSDLDAYMVERRGDKVAVIAAGDMLPLGAKTCDKLEEKGIKPTLINPRFLSGLDEQLLLELTKDHQLVITIEDGSLAGGWGESVARFYGPMDMKVKCYGIDKQLRNRFDPAEVARALHLTPDQIAADAQSLLNW
ncbi:MAG: 1-deoxy-D-xylulose-5-phosphate synthase [Candidatus Amulumruptor caecigallinarius]|nr:1-deoxy-D-xylulose-5-phosphate synthase [Candidatus Amulumruptor caecigallinarius]MCM1397831.1 1-deoxy-D-xylulose-5-phosphate synthase [Candidatus Amulumruptor caecigallinarius]MCM1454613.1 1-deoxy-D-xylulose-5-phosphate synthase [bacterium]